MVYYRYHTSNITGETDNNITIHPIIQPGKKLMHKQIILYIICHSDYLPFLFSLPFLSYDHGGGRFLCLQFTLYVRNVYFNQIQNTGSEEKNCLSKVLSCSLRFSIIYLFCIETMRWMALKVDLER